MIYHILRKLHLCFYLNAYFFYRTTNHEVAYYKLQAILTGKYLTVYGNYPPHRSNIWQMHEIPNISYLCAFCMFI